MPEKRSRGGGRRRCLRACETCKRRKERCDGHQPCRRCMIRGVDADCRITHAPLPVMLESLLPSPESDPEGWGGNNENPFVSSPELRQVVPGRPLPRLPALAKDERGTYMYIGDAATLSFLHSARRIVQSVLAHCDFVDDPLGPHTGEAHPGAASDRPTAQDVTKPPPKPTLEEVGYLTHWFMLATNCLLNIVDQQEHAEPSDSQNTIYYLTLALGAQSCPEDKDQIAESYFTHARYLTMTIFMEDPSLVTIQCQLLITMYLLAGSRRNSAFMYLGSAVRAAYALGLHQQEVSTLYHPVEYSTRERLWRAIRILDLFMSASLGRPPSTTETRDTTSRDNYSASNDLCFIFEKILTQIYAKRMVSSAALTRITHLHRGWTSRFTTGLMTDGIPNARHLETDRGAVPNIGLIQLKGAYYWTVMLLTQPALIDKISAHTSSPAATPPPDASSPVLSASNDTLASACVDSAIRTNSLLASIVSSAHVPKRLPLIANSAFLSALVVGLAVFGDIDQVLPLARSLEDARMVLAKFAPHDAVAKSHLAVVDTLRSACEKYAEIRIQHNMARQGRLIGGLFGCLPADIDSDNPCGDVGYPTRRADQKPHENEEDGQVQNENIIDSPLYFQSDTPFPSMPSASGYTPLEDMNSSLGANMLALSFDYYDVRWWPLA
ncbi:hypothetical protein BDW72DRAFT_208999 [Aspergillus terricola var. indicus]